MWKDGLRIYVQDDISATVEDSLGVRVEGLLGSFVVNVKKIWLRNFGCYYLQDI